MGTLFDYHHESVECSIFKLIVDLLYVNTV